MKEVSEPVLDGIRELVTMGIGRSAGSLNTLTGFHVTISVPHVSLLKKDEIQDFIPHTDIPYCLVNLRYSGSFEGTAALMFSQASAASLFLLLTGETDRSEETEDLWELTIIEVGNIIINAVMGSISNNLGTTLHFCTPEYHEDSLDHLLPDSVYGESESIIVADAQFCVKAKDIFGEVVLFLADDSIDVLAASIREKMGLVG